MLDETASQLVRHLEHPNGWWRDTAQRLLVLKQDRSVVPALQKLAATASSIDARFHALWTLEGLRALDASLVREQMKDANPRMRVQAIRASETLYKAGDKSFAAEYRALTKDADVDVVIQAMLTLNLLKVSDGSATIQSAIATNKARGVQEIGKFLMTPAPTTSTAGRPLSPKSSRRSIEVRRSTRSCASPVTPRTGAALRWAVALQVRCSRPRLPGPRGCRRTATSSSRRCSMA